MPGTVLSAKDMAMNNNKTKNKQMKIASLMEITLYWERQRNVVYYTSGNKCSKEKWTKMRGQTVTDGSKCYSTSGGLGKPL